MRMWNINPELMCNKHLLGEHVEMHMFIGTINKGVSIKGYLKKGLVEPHYINKRHQDLVEEMEHRGMKHNSELPKFLVVPKEKGYVDGEANLLLISERCEECKGRIISALHKEIEFARRTKNDTLRDLRRRDKQTEDNSNRLRSSSGVLYDTK